MLAESIYKGVLDNGNFREFLHGAGGNFRLSKREFPVALVQYYEYIITRSGTTLYAFMEATEK